MSGKSGVDDPKGINGKNHLGLILRGSIYHDWGARAQSAMTFYATLEHVTFD